MNLFSLITISFKSMFSNKMRTVLTLLGVVISVIVIMSMITMGEILRNYITDQIESFGSDMIQVEISVPETDHMSRENMSKIATGVQITTLTADDAEAISALPNVADHTAGLTGQALLRYKDYADYGLLFGTSHTNTKVDKGSEIEYGRFFSQAEEKSSANVLVLGHQEAEDIFGYVGGDLIGKRVKLNNKKYRLVGILKERGSISFISFDKVVYLPYTTLQKKILNIDHLSYISVKVHDVSKISRTADDIERLLISRHEIDKKEDQDFAVTTIDEAQETFDTILGSVTLFLLALASISMLVGGIGIMNIMIVSIEERLAEIGLRKSLGARRYDIIKQFLIESIIISCVGAIFGIIFTVALLSVAFFYAGSLGFDGLNLYIPAKAVLISLIFSVVVGIVFGVYPARKASRISPIEALSS